ELSGLRFTFAKFSVVIPCVPGADDHGIHREIVVCAISQQTAQRAPKSYRFACDMTLKDCHQRTKRGMNHREQQSAEHVPRKSPQPPPTFKTQMLAQPENDWRQQRPLVPVAERPVKCLAPTDLMPKRRRGEIHLGREE